MSVGQLNPLLLHLRRLAGGPSSDNLSDQQLLAHFRAAREESAFAVIDAAARPDRLAAILADTLARAGSGMPTNSVTLPQSEVLQSRNKRRCVLVRQSGCYRARRLAP
jgi:hypothetical protein